MFEKKDVQGKNVSELLDEIYEKAHTIEQTGFLTFNELVRAVGLIDFTKLFYIHSGAMIPEELIKAEHIIRRLEMNIDENMGRGR